MAIEKERGREGGRKSGRNGEMEGVLERGKTGERRGKTGERRGKQYHFTVLILYFFRGGNATCGLQCIPHAS